MVRLDDGGSQEPTSKDAVNPGKDFLDGQKAMKVNVTDLSSYAWWMKGTQLNLTGSAKTASGKIAVQLETGVHAGKYGMNHEMAYAILAVKCNMKDFEQFMFELGQGLTNISNAAQTIADSYQGSDAESAASLSDVAFAFGDPNAKRPPGLPTNIGQTEAAYQYEQDQKNGGQAAEALSANPNTIAGMPGVTAHPNKDGTTTYKFSDGSSLVLQTNSSSTHYSSDETRTSVVRNADGEVVGNTEYRDQRMVGGYQTTTQTERDPSTGKVTRTTTTEHNPDGSQEITIKTPGQEPIKQHVNGNADPKATPTDDPLMQQPNEVDNGHYSKYGIVG